MENCFTSFKSSIKEIELPKKFTFPFNYNPHPLAVLAANELKDHIESQTDWIHNFGFDNPEGVGKMFGVLVVKNAAGEIGYLSSYSGVLANKTILPHFVPPIYDRKSQVSFYTALEEEINVINREIASIQSSKEYLLAIEQKESDINEANLELKKRKKVLKESKTLRDHRRAEAYLDVEGEPLEVVLTQLSNESKNESYEYKKLARYWRSRLQKNEEVLAKHTEQLSRLKESRKSKSGDLQIILLDEYQLLNSNQEVRSVTDIFKEKLEKFPPSGTGDCAAPKFLQYAFQQGFEPIAMAEFWWGKSPSLEVRKHNHFYPACKNKCEPILQHMLIGIEMDDNPVVQVAKKIHIIETVYEDDSIIIINKPSGLLSVPGKQIRDSVESRLKKKYPNATGPMLAHRLDMSTSGLMLISKSLEIHRILQKQFADRKVKKRYLAVLDGTLKSNQGTIELPLRVDIDNRPSQVVDFEYGKKAITNWELIEVIENQSRVYFYPITGRTHQLRVHASHPLGLNAPICGDDIYGTHSERLYLQAIFIQFLHPITNKEVSFELSHAF